MIRAVIFDFYGTLAQWRYQGASHYTEVFADQGYVLPEQVVDAYVARYDGIEHGEHSLDREAYEDWVRFRLRDLTGACAVAPAHEVSIIDALRDADQGEMQAYSDAAPALRAIREKDWATGVCSNWGWDLDPFLRQVELLDLIDSAVTSARAGARKPHPSIYTHTLEELNIDASEAVFVGDSWGPDVEGPRRVGMTAVHLWRIGERRGTSPVELPRGTYRIGDLAELLPLLSEPFR